MRAYGIQAKTYKLWKKTAANKTLQEIDPNHVNQNFTVDAPNKTWASDSSYILVKDGYI